MILYLQITNKWFSFDDDDYTYSSERGVYTYTDDIFFPAKYRAVGKPETTISVDVKVKNMDMIKNLMIAFENKQAINYHINNTKGKGIITSLSIEEFVIEDFYRLCFDIKS